MKTGHGMNSADTLYQIENSRPADQNPYKLAHPTEHKAYGEAAGKREWTSTLLLVEEACESIRASEERVESLERELEMQLARARDEQRVIAAKLLASQDELKKAEALIKSWESRALEAEGWLTRLNDALVSNFGATLRKDSV